MFALALETPFLHDLKKFVKLKEDGVGTTGVGDGDSAVIRNYPYS